jgi:ligand-binding sensor domain-containing protein
MLGNITGFTSLAFCWGINAGSKFIGALNSWMGVMNSTDLGVKWHDVSVLPPAQAVGQVFDLAAYRTRFDARQRLLAATNDGLKFVEGDLDTGCWYPLDPQLKAMTPKSVHVSYFSRSFISEFWVAGDSGVYVLSGRINTVDWARLYDKKSNCVIDDAAVDPQRWFAGTIDGIWMFPGKNVGVAPRAPDRAARRLTGSKWKAFTLDGRRCVPENRNGARGAAAIRIRKK